MKKLFINVAQSLVLTLSWATLLTMFGVWLFRRYSVVPTFPYYHILLLNLRDAAYALWGYFDGVHYLRIVSVGYVDTGSQAFFPLYPILIRGISHILSLTPYLSGIILSLLSLTGSITVLKYLFPTKHYYHIIPLLLFPTSFFFFGLYTESLFLVLSLLFFLLVKQKRFFLASIIAGFASATRIVGLILSISLLYLLIINKPKQLTLHYYVSSLSLLFISASGFLCYSTYLWTHFHDPLMYLHVQSMFGANRSGSEIILLPQVFYRYLKMVLTVDPQSFLYQRIWLELISFLIATIAWINNLKHNQPHISIYVALSLLLPTLTGTLSSFPRYTLVLIPFLLPASMSKFKYYLLSAIFFALMLYLFTQYCYGIFIA